MLSAQELYYFVLSVVALVVGGFLTWVLYQLGMLLKQGNEVTTEVRDRAARVEESVMDVKDRLESSLRILSLLAEGGKTVLSALMGKSGEYEEEEEEAPVRRRLMPKKRKFVMEE